MSFTALIPLALTAASMIYDYLNKPEYRGVDPNTVAGMKYNEADFRRDWGFYKGELLKSAALQNSQIKSYGAANRLPQGAVLDALGGVQERTAQGMERIYPILLDKKRGYNRDYYNLLNQYQLGQMAYEQDWLNRMQGGFGALSNIATLWAMGKFNK